METDKVIIKTHARPHGTSHILCADTFATETIGYVFEQCQGSIIHRRVKSPWVINRTLGVAASSPWPVSKRLLWDIAVHRRLQCQGHVIHNYIYFASPPRKWSMYCDQRIWISVCRVVYLKNQKSKFHEILCTYYLWSWLGPLLTTVQWDGYFHFCGWRHDSHNGHTSHLRLLQAVWRHLSIVHGDKVCYRQLRCLVKYFWNLRIYFKSRPLNNNTRTKL